MAALTKVGDFEYRVTGRAEYWVRSMKEVKVDGEIYHRYIVNQVEIDFDSEIETEKPDLYWKAYTIDEFAFLGIPAVTVWVCCCYGSSAIEMCYLPEFSKNSHVNLLWYLHSEGAFGDKIIQVFSDRGLMWDVVEHSLFKECQVIIPLRSYGYGYVLYASVSIQTFLESGKPPERLHTRYEKFIPELTENIQPFTPEKQYEIADRLLSIQIKRHDNR